MKINKMTSYGFRVVARLYREQGRVVTSTELSKKESIPAGVLMKVLSKLRDAGIVESHQGRGQVAGGFSLTDQKGEISLCNLLEALEGGVHIYLDSEKDMYDGNYEELFDNLIKLNDMYKEILSEYKMSEML